LGREGIGQATFAPFEAAANSAGETHVEGVADNDDRWLRDDHRSGSISATTGRERPDQIRPGYIEYGAGAAGQRECATI
jgi:hypothetical protein